MPQLSPTTTYANEEVNEVLGSTPSFFVRAGNALLLGMAAIILVLSAVITYPRVMEGKVTVIPKKRSLITSPASESTATPANYTVWIYMPPYGTGRIQPGQQVHINLERFPKDEFGELTARVISPPRYDSTGYAIVEATLTNMATTFGYQPDIGAGASGISFIVTGRKSLLSELLP
jgi:hypothetical protein